MSNQPVTATATAPASTDTRFAWWSPLTFGLISAIVLGLVALLMTNLGAAVFAVGIAAFALAAIGVAALALGGSANYLRWGIAVVALIAVGVVGVLAANPAYHAAIALARSNGNYATAVSEERAIGEAPPYSQDLAQTYLDWAKAEIGEHAFAPAVDHLTYVAAQFPTLPQAATASAQLPDVHLTWARFASQHNDAITAGQQYQIVLTTYASSTAASQARGEAAPVLLAWGQQLMRAGYYQDAFTAFSLILKDFAASPQATQAHALAAQDELTLAQAETAAHRYDLAAQSYQNLAANFGGTSQGQQANKILSQGVEVIGRLFRTDGKTPAVMHTTVRLSSQWTLSNGVYFASGRQYYADTDANGYFAFLDVVPGQYLLEWHNTSGVYETLVNGNTFTAVISVLPLQPRVLAPIVTDEATSTP